MCMENLKFKNFIFFHPPTISESERNRISQTRLKKTGLTKVKVIQDPNLILLSMALLNTSL